VDGCGLFGNPNPVGFHRSNMSESTRAAGLPPTEAPSPFAATRWTVVLTAAAPDAPDAGEAFGRLYRDYWPALYGYVRRRGHEPAAAEDITQDFFAHLLEKQRLNGLTREGGRFRSFLLTALKHHLANEWDRSRAGKRGGGLAPLSLDDVAAESAFQQTTADPAPAEQAFDRQWALTVLDLARRQLEKELAESGKADWLHVLGSSLLGGGGDSPRAGQAAQLGMSEGALKVAIHRLRKRFGELLRQEIARTVDDPIEAAAELRYLIEVVGRAG
jgi:RNA polymerase sigma-70 factor (ECF subfamily)